MDHKIVIPEPCQENWASMSPTQKGRFCASCSKEVVDFTNKDKSSIVHFIQNADERVCGRFSPHQVDIYGSSPSTLKKQSKSWIAGIMAAIGLMIPVKESKAQKMGKVAIKGQSMIIDAHPVLKKEIGISGTLKNSLGEKIANATVNLWCNKKLIATTRSISNGRYSFQLPPVSLENEKIELEVIADDYETEHRELFIEKNKLTADFTLGIEVFMLGEVAWRPEDTLESNVEEVPQTNEALIGDTLVQSVSQTEETILIDPSIEITHVEDTLEDSGFETNDQEEQTDEAPLELHKELEILVRQEDIDIALWPNPSLGLLQVSYKNEFGWQYEVLDNLGRKLSSGWSNQAKKEINMAFLPSGQYFLKLTPFGKPDEIRTVRFIRE